MKLKLILAVTMTACLFPVQQSHAEFSGDPGQGGPMTYCRYFHTLEGNKVSSLDIYETRLVFASTCPSILPPVGPDGELHEIVGDLPATDPRHLNDPNIDQKVDDKNCVISIDSGNVI
jgi:hypothetical protein